MDTKKTFLINLFNYSNILKKCNLSNLPIKIFIICVCLHEDQQVSPLYIYLLIYYLPAFTVTRKKEKKTRQEQEIKISRTTARGKKKK